MHKDFVRDTSICFFLHPSPLPSVLSLPHTHTLPNLPLSLPSSLSLYSSYLSLSLSYLGEYHINASLQSLFVVNLQPECLLGQILKFLWGQLIQDSLELSEELLCLSILSPWPHPTILSLVEINLRTCMQIKGVRACNINYNTSTTNYSTKHKNLMAIL